MSQSMHVQNRVAVEVHGDLESENEYYEQRECL